MSAGEQSGLTRWRAAGGRTLRASAASSLPGLPFSGSWPLAVIGLLCIPIILFGLDRYSLVNEDEAVYHVIAATMVESGDWLHLQLYGEPAVYDTFMNAPLQYWARAILIALFGDNMWTMRIMSALFAVASIFMTFRLANRLGDRRSAFLASLIQLTTFQFIYLHSARTGELEPIVVFFFTLIAFLFVRGIETRGSFVAHHVCIALLFNFKSLTVIMPLLAEVGCFVLLPQSRPAFRRFALSGLVILPLGLSWHVSRAVALWEPFLGVMNRMAQQATTEIAGGRVEGWALAVVFYAATLLVGAFPYSLAYPLALTGLFRRSQSPAERLRWKVIVLYMVAIFVFCVFTSKNHRWYIMPLYPFLSILLGSWLAGIPARRTSVALLAGVAALFALLLWTGVDVSDYNPFAHRAFLIPMLLRLRGGLGLTTAAGIILSFTVILWILVRARSATGSRFPSYLAVAIAAVLLSYGLIRVLVPLRYIDHQSRIARLRSDLDARRAAGVELEYPIDPGIRWRWDARFYLGREYRIEEREGGAFLLHPRGDTRGKEL